MTDSQATIRHLLEKHGISQRAFSEIILGIENPNGPESMSAEEKNRHYDKFKKQLRRNSTALLGYYDILIDHLANMPGTQRTIEMEIRSTYRSNIPTNIAGASQKIGKEIRKLSENKNAEKN